MAAIHCYYVAGSDQDVCAGLVLAGKLIDRVALWAIIRDEISSEAMSPEVRSPHAVCRRQVTH